MSAFELRHVLAVLAALAMCTTVVSSAVAASKPSIRGVELHGKSSFVAVWLVVYGSKDIVVCVSRKCTRAFNGGAGSWNSLVHGLPNLRKGQNREVIVFAGPGLPMRGTGSP
jgi:hypothetical protein